MSDHRVFCLSEADFDSVAETIAALPDHVDMEALYRDWMVLSDEMEARYKEHWGYKEVSVMGGWHKQRMHSVSVNAPEALCKKFVDISRESLCHAHTGMVFGLYVHVGFSIGPEDVSMLDRYKGKSFSEIPDLPDFIIYKGDVFTQRNIDPDLLFIFLNREEE